MKDFMKFRSDHSLKIYMAIATLLISGIATAMEQGSFPQQLRINTIAAYTSRNNPRYFELLSWIGPINPSDSRVSIPTKSGNQSDKEPSDYTCSIKFKSLTPEAIIVAYTVRKQYDSQSYNTIDISLPIDPKYTPPEPHYQQEVLTINGDNNPITLSITSCLDNTPMPVVKGFIAASTTNQ